MPVSIDEYVKQVHRRAEVRWPAMPAVEAPKVKPHVPALTGIRAVLWNGYGTLLATSGGELRFESDNDFLMGVALKKTIEEFKMWASMSRKPGAPEDYMKEIYRKALDEQRMMSSPEKTPDILAERIWEGIVKKLRDYKYDVGYYGALPDYAKKIAYFFHASLQGVGCYANVATTLRDVQGAGIVQGLLADGQCFTAGQLARCVEAQEEGFAFDMAFPPKNRFISFEKLAKKPSDTLFEYAVDTLGAQGISPEEILHVGSSLPRDIGPAKKWGMRTALFAGDRASLVATGDQLKDPQYRPDALLTDIGHVTQLLS